ncbi:thermonuclease family protein [Photobacterium phosphoreum]|uniref:thermonuclease family protein n=1 Tax=Photobacterium phosphoreum TaxID=659 RepID=UPI001E53F2EB|nr:thermonuclease family protein [Photobacterium phosphoreum]MCD9477141.1 thermonuclease family protein [Photobacterium phosphoreum]MCF2177982.1 thermonuclease family protein [Photobacterium phosphoreum]
MIKFRYILMAIGLWLTSSVSFALPQSVTITPSAIASIYDGDTFRAYIQGITPQGERSTRIRIRHLDTPEIKGKCPAEIKGALAARAKARQWLMQASTIQLSHLGYDRYGRLLATVTLNGQQSYANKMIQQGLARPYEGKKRQGWCY